MTSIPRLQVLFTIFDSLSATMILYNDLLNNLPAMPVISDDHTNRPIALLSCFLRKIHENPPAAAIAPCFLHSLCCSRPGLDPGPPAIVLGAVLRPVACRPEGPRQLYQRRRAHPEGELLRLSRC